MRFFIFLLILNIGSILMAQEKSPYQAALEIDIAQRAETMIEKIVGKERALVRVKIKLEEPATFTSQKSTMPLRGTPGVVILPPPPKKGLSKFAYIKNIAVVVYIDNTVPEEKIEEIKKRLPEWLELDFTRGDTLIIHPMPWKKVTPEDAGIKQINLLRRNLLIIAIIAAIVVILFILTIVGVIVWRKKVALLPKQAKTSPEISKFTQQISRMDTIMEDIKELLRRSTAKSETGRIDKILEDIRDILSSSPSKADLILEEIKEQLSKLSTSAGIGGEGFQRGFVDALADAISRVSTQITETQGEGGLGRGALEVLNKIQELLQREVELTEAPHISEIDRPFTYINTLPPQDIYLLIRDEDDRLASIILAHINPDKASQVLKMLDVKKQTNIILQLVTLKEDEKIVEEIKEFLKRKLKIIKMYQDYQPKEGLPTAADIVSSLPYPLTKTLLQNLKKRNPKIVKELERFIFTFDDIKNLDDRAVQEIIKYTDRETLAYALAGSSVEVREKIFNNSTERLRNILQEDINSIEKIVVPLHELEEKKITSFEQIVNLDIQVIQEVMKVLKRETILVALKGASEEIKEKFYSSMSERGAAILKEDLEVMPHVSERICKDAQEKIIEEINKILSKSILAQQEIVRIAKRLEREGKISLGGRK